MLRPFCNRLSRAILAGVVWLSLDVALVRLCAQTVFPPPIEWQKNFGGTNDDRLRALAPTADGGFILGGFSDSAPASGIYGNKTSQNLGNYDFWVVRVDAHGNSLWDRSYGGTNEDVLYSLQQTRDGGFVLGGYSLSGANGNKSSGNFGGYDFWVVRLSAGGNKLWDYSFGGTNDDYLRSLTETTDGGFMLGGQSLSEPGGNKTSPLYGMNDFWVVRLNANGQKLWDRSFGGIGADRLQSLQQTSDGGFILGGVSLSGISGNKASLGYGLNDYWVVRIDGGGNKLWDRSFGGTDNDELLSLLQTTDGGFACGGFSWSGANGNKTSRNYGMTDFWFVRLDASGNKVWEQSFGGRDADSLRAMEQTTDGGFILGGVSSSGTTGTKITSFYGVTDYWIVRINAVGNELWQQSIGGTGDEGIWGLAYDGGFIFGGGSDSLVGGNKTSPNFGEYDYWVVKLQTDAARLRVTGQTSSQIRQDGFRLFLSGVSNNSYRTEYTSNWTTWIPLQTNQLAGSEVQVVDRAATNGMQRHYRARLLP
jgi:hypothetical protein